VSKRKDLIAAVLGTLAFMGIVGEHVLAEVAGKFLVQFLASMVTLFPAGAIIIGILEECKERELSFGFRFHGAILATLLVTIAIIGVHVVLEFGNPGHTPFLDLIKPVFAWWFLFNFCTWLVAVKRIALTDAAPIIGVLLSALLIGLVALPIGHSLPSMPWLPDALKHSPITAVGHYGEEVIDFSLVYPGTPQQFWAAAELESHEVPYSRPVGWGPWLASLIENPSSSSNDKIVADRRHLLATQLRREFGSGLVRSWLVMLFFAYGISLAPAAERRLRPLCYGASVTRRKDFFAWLIALVFLAFAAVAVHVR
jgi:hypothetical protein